MGIKGKTLIELKEQITKLTSSFSSVISYNAIGTLVNAGEEETLLHEIEDSYNKLVSYINSQNNESIGICDDNLIFLKGEEKATTIFKTATFTGETFQCNFSYINENTEILKHANDLYDKIENYNFIYKEKKIPQIFKKTDSIQPTDYPEILIVTKDKVVQKDQYDSVFEEWSYGFDYTKKYPFFCEKMINLYYKPTTKNEKIEICGLIIDGNTLFKTLKNRFEECAYPGAEGRVPAEAGYFRAYRPCRGSKKGFVRRRMRMHWQLRLVQLQSGRRGHFPCLGRNKPVLWQAGRAAYRTRSACRNHSACFP
jgi:hypothetical protein